MRLLPFNPRQQHDYHDDVIGGGWCDRPEERHPERASTLWTDLSTSL
jgi:hypothetical protein